MANIRPQDPIGLGLCRQIELDEAIAKAERSLKRAEKKKEKEEKERLAQTNKNNLEKEESSSVTIEE
jgi:hypothetical protein